jgi:hypothetical protein
MGPAGKWEDKTVRSIYEYYFEHCPLSCVLPNTTFMKKELVPPAV